MSMQIDANTHFQIQPELHVIPSTESQLIRMLLYAAMDIRRLHKFQPPTLKPTSAPHPFHHELHANG